jgi:hypothetical protein
MIIVVSILPYVIGFFAISTLIVLAIGVLGMARNRGSDEKYSNILMRWRVSLQGITLAFLALHVVLKNIF